MAIILNIDTSADTAGICIAENGVCLCELSNDQKKNHAAWLHEAINSALEQTKIHITSLSAVGINAGPGSYTGLRVAMAAAKGLCYALDIPLICVNTLEIIARMDAWEGADYICPSLYAREMEVYTCLYDKSLQLVMPPCVLKPDENSFSAYLRENTVLFLVSGKNIFEQVLHHNNAIYKSVIFNVIHLSTLTYRKFIQSNFTPIAYLEPLYLKADYLPVIK